MCVIQRESGEGFVIFAECNMIITFRGNVNIHLYKDWAVFTIQ